MTSLLGYLVSTGIEEFVGEARVGLEEVGLQPPGRFHGHLGAVLEDVDGELLAGHTGQPQAEVAVDLQQQTPQGQIFDI